ncbi:MAG: GNAT family N-acetyltransferase [Selenomonadaceae bacterium]|nr:GNAT family N-acetyltransferase [Selenomonadaceae bacterium]
MSNVILENKGLTERSLLSDLKVVPCNNVNWLLSDEAFSIYSSCMYKPSYEKYKSKIEQFIDNSIVKIFLCEDNDKKLGILILNRSDTFAEIVGLAVRGDCRFKGIGRHMISQVMECEKLNCVKVQTDDETIDFYRKCGFTEERIVTKYTDGSSVRYNCFLANEQ